MKIQEYFAITVVIVILLLVVGYAGYVVYPKLNPTPLPTRDTLYIHDTVPHFIPDSIPYYVSTQDTIIHTDTIPADVDTIAILRDYYSAHMYTRTWEDSLLTVTLKDVIVENKPISNKFTYKILRPQTVVTNVTNNYSYGRYVTVGLDVPLKDLKYVNLEALYVTSRWYGGVGYNAGLQSLTVKAGIPIYKFK